VMLPLTFIVGLYGMNFKHMPELDWDYGYPAAIGLMVVVAGSIVLWFRHRGWIGGDRIERAEKAESAERAKRTKRTEPAEQD
jgi:hypothetical protein